MVKNQNTNGTLKETTYSKVEVEDFLNNTGNRFASLCWHNDITTDRVPYTQITTWFRRYFADSNRAQFMFRLMEAHCIGYTEFAETQNS
jgi:hypothetical protein